MICVTRDRAPGEDIFVSPHVRCTKEAEFRLVAKNNGGSYAMCRNHCLSTHMLMEVDGELVSTSYNIEPLN